MRRTATSPQPTDFLHRLAGAPNDVACDAHEDVAAHLQRLLNTRQGEALCRSDYGLSDLTSLVAGLPHTAEALAQTIRTCINAFEPRLIVHKVQLVDDALQQSVHFDIEASFVTHARGGRTATPLHLYACMDGRGRIEVRL